ncbi:S8 family peptidase [Halonatronum saccharophilum]|uniref:S8 family peptidase n=1 Tax=Halonatronum saccharophilum TaxID=150060 RepID=UPI000489A10D|nr:S8 family peptidase [Halonatronum saccharophilum]
MQDQNKFPYPNLELVNIPHDKEERYKSQPGGGAFIPPDKDRKTHSEQVKTDIDRIQKQIKQQAKDKGINPHLIFKIEYEKPLLEDDLMRGGCRLLGEIPTGGKAQVVFSNEEMMEQFLERWDKYSNGELTSSNNPPYVSFFNNIKQLKRLEPEDRKGSKLQGKEIIDDEYYWVDIELWYSGSELECKSSEQDIKTIIGDQGRITDYYIDNHLHMLRAEVSGYALKELLNEDIVCQIDFPPKLMSKGIRKVRTPLSEINPGTPDEDAAGVCIIDSGVMPKHPLLENAIVDYDVFRGDLNDGIDENGHGTFVAGIALYGDINECIEKNEFIPEVKLYSARVTDEDSNLGPNDKIYIKQIKRAIEYYNNQFGCRIFNISLGDPDNIYKGNQYQSKWAQVLDNLVRERDIIVVISTGNITPNQFQEQFDISGEGIVKCYPEYLFKESAGLLDPATATNCLTVGSVSTELRTSRGYRNPQEKAKGIRKVSIASVNQPSPFTRCGLGINDTIKPEFVAYGGNMYYDGDHKALVGGNIETGVFSINHKYMQDDKLFACDTGTSFSAPFIANLSARILNYNFNFTNNTIRALLSNSAIPSEEICCLLKDYMNQAHSQLVSFLQENKSDFNEEIEDVIQDCIDKGIVNVTNKGKLLKSNSCSEELKNLLEVIPGYDAEFDKYLLRICGYGIPNLNKALYSSDNRVTLYAEGKIRLDNFDVYEIPVPEDFINNKGIRKIIISLAHTPPTRHTRKDYSGYSMGFELIRGKSLSEVLEIASNDTKEKTYSKMGAERCELQPNSTLIRKSTLQRAVFERTRSSRVDYGDTYYLVVRSEDNWLGNSIGYSEDMKEDYSVVVTLEHYNEEVEIYEQIKQRVENRLKQRNIQHIVRRIGVKP